MVKVPVRGYRIAAVALMFAIPCLLANSLYGAILGFVLFAVVFFLPGYLILFLLGGGSVRCSPYVAFVFGLGLVTTGYDIAARGDWNSYFAYLLILLSAGGLLVFARSFSPSTDGMSMRRREANDSQQGVLAGAFLALVVGLLFWRSGRSAGDEFAFYGPTAYDQLYHVTLVQRLLHHVPPDNFIFAGLPPPTYHYFNDQLLALILKAQEALHFGRDDVFDVYFRCYPAILYFFLGALAYRLGFKLLGSKKGGVLAALLLLGAGGLPSIVGMLDAISQIAHPSSMGPLLFSNWTDWDGVGSTLPLVHRPAHYNGLLFCLAALDALLKERRTAHDWIVAGLLIGLSAGFNYTLAGILGVAAVLASAALFLRRQNTELKELLWLTGSIFIGALPKNITMLSAGFKNSAPGFPFSGPNLEFPVMVWGAVVQRIVPSVLVPIFCLVLFSIVCYGVKLAGLPAMLRGELAGAKHRGIALLLAFAFALSFIVGAFFTYRGVAGVGAGIIFLQPTLWMLGLFSLHPLQAWLQRGRELWRPVVLWGLLGLTWVQSLVAFNLGSKVTFSPASVKILSEIGSVSSPDDVVVYLPTTRKSRPILGNSEQFSDYAIMAMTGLDGYFGAKSNSLYYAVPGLAGATGSEILGEADKLYRQRMNDVAAYLSGNPDQALLKRFANDKVRWIVLSEGAPFASADLKTWRRSDQVTVYRVP